MKIPTLFRLGGLAIILSQILFLINNLFYLLQGEQPPDTFRSLMTILGTAIFILGLTALYASLAQPGGVVGLIAFVLLYFAYLVDIPSWTMNLAVAEGIVTRDQINQVSILTTIYSFLNWMWWLGLLLFGLIIWRTSVYPKAAGVLVALIAPVSYLTGVLDFMTPVFTILVFVVWVWLGWLLGSNRGAVIEAT